MVREVTFTDCEETLNRSLEFVVYPNTTHCIVNGGIDHHRSFVGAFVSDFFVHVEEVTITSFDFLATEVLNSLREVEEYSETSVVYAEALVATFFRST